MYRLLKKTELTLFNLIPIKCNLIIFRNVVLVNQPLEDTVVGKHWNGRSNSTADKCWYNSRKTDRNITEKRLI